LFDIRYSKSSEKPSHGNLIMAEPKQAETKTPTAWAIAKSLTIIGVALSLFQLYTAGMVAMTAMRHRSVF
jgi:TRAP-type uncharacterized transport system fused permease subunit